MPKRHAMYQIQLVCLAVIAIGLTLAPVHALARMQTTAEPEARRHKAADGTMVDYTLLVPKGFDKSRPTPVLVAIPPGDQSAAMVEAANVNYWKGLADRGWLVVALAAPAGKLFHAGAEKYVPEVLTVALIDVAVEGGKPHLAGVSNGGVSAFRIAIDRPDLFASLTVLPGVPLEDDVQRLERLRGVTVTILVGENDGAVWRDGARTTTEKLRSLGVTAQAEVIPSQGHLLELKPDKLAAIFDPLRAAAAEDRRLVNAVLDDFHDAAAKADGPRYFAHFAPDAVFLGTDGTERWTLEQFRAFAEPYFSKGRGWTYTSTRRAVTLSPSREAAWFDEDLSNTRFGLCRGSGALIKLDGVWKITQYNLSVPVPNDLTDKLVEMIRAMPAPAPAAPEPAPQNP